MQASVKRGFRLGCALLLSCAAFILPLRGQDSSIVLDRLRHPAFTTRHSTAHWSADGTLSVQFEAAEWPSVAVQSRPPWNWRDRGGIAVTLRNPNDASLDFGIRVDDDASADGSSHCRTGSGTIAPHTTTTCAVTFGKEPMAYGMRALPAPPGVVGIGSSGKGPFEPAHIVSFQVFMHQPARPCELVIVQVHTIAVADLAGIVDRFGQYARAEWPGKVHQETDLVGRRKRETLAPGNSRDRDMYGGWKSGPSFNATGYFRTERRNGVWWLVTPLGHAFFSCGVDGVQSNRPTMISGRESMFTGLPTPSAPLAHHYAPSDRVLRGPVTKGTTFDFYRANLERKYGSEWDAEWQKVSLDRLSAWGFNTIGNWSDGRLARAHRVPYVATGGVWGGHAHVSTANDYWEPISDPFDAKFAHDVVGRMREVASWVRDDPWCVGYFVENELPWGAMKNDAQHFAIAYGVLAADVASSPAKRAFVAQLRARYPTIDSLNASWHSNFRSWEALGPPIKETAGIPRTDLSRFTLSFAEQYFRVVRDSLRGLDPNHLYLGCRFAWLTPEAVQAAARYCDVISFNVYAHTLDRRNTSRISPHDLGRGLENIDRPCIIGEFHFGALDRGMFHAGLVPTATQAERAASYAEYVRSVADDPLFVGCHWFEYVDEPLTGRPLDGECFNIGLVDVTDTPYAELTSAATTANGEVYRRHRAARP